MIDSEELLKAIGLESAETIEDVKAHIEKTFIPTNLIQENELIKTHVGKVIGKRIGEAETRVKANAKALGIELDDIGGKKFEEILEAFSEKVSAKQKELQELAGKGDDAKVAELQKETEKLKTKLAEKENFLTAAVQEKEKVVNEFAGYKTTLKKNELTSKAWGSLLYSDGATELVKKGFQSLVNDKYEVRLPNEDETATKDGLVVIDKTTGERPKGATDFTSFAEILQSEAKTANILKVGGHTGKPAPAKPVVQDETPKVNKPINRAEQHLEKLNATK